MSLVKLNIKGISYSQTQSGAYALVLSEVNGVRTLPIIIGAFEAQSIAIALEKEIKPPRPLTHDLFKSFADKFEIQIQKIIIHKLVDGVFFSSLVCERDNREQVIDTRTSDAIALAVRFNAPIFTYENILDKAGIYLKKEEESGVTDELELSNLDIELEIDEDIDSNNENEDNFAILSLDELHEELHNAVTDENYELAAKIRDEIDKRS